jgi:beta-phosphoglucomutase
MTRSSTIDDARTLISNARGALFDFNGTLSIDEELVGGLYADAARELCGIELGWEEYQERFVGISDLEICEALSGGDATLAERLLEHMCTAYIREITVNPRIPAENVRFVRELVESGVKVAVVTGTMRRLLEPALRASGLDVLVSATVCCEDVAEGKPHPEGFLRGAELIGISSSELVVFEDSRAGIGAARAAGIACVLVGPLSASAPEGTHPVGSLGALLS